MIEAAVLLILTVTAILYVGLLLSIAYIVGEAIAEYQIRA